MNYSILSDNSIPLQAQMATANTIYEIRGDFDFSNETNGQVTVPNNCLLRFNGGSFSNGVLIADDCKIESPLVKIFDHMTFQGNFLNGITFPDSGYEDNEMDPKEEYRQLRKTRLNVDGLNENYGYVWDLGGHNNSLWNCKYIAKPIGVGFLFDDTQEKYSPVEIVRPTDVFYPNLLADFSKYENQGITVETKLYREEENISGKTDIYETLQFKRYQFPDYLMRSDHLSWNSVDNSDAGYTVVDSSNVYEYKYVTKITIQGWPLIMAFQDRPPMYISPIFPENDFFVKVKYYNNSAPSQSVKKIFFKLPSDAVGSSYYYGRFVKIANIIHENLDSETSRVVIKFVQKFKGNALIARPIFFIPNYHADKIVRKGDCSLVNLTGVDAGQTFYDTSLQKLVVWNGSEWKDALGNSLT